MKTITVVAEDKVGLLAEISYILSKAKISIDGMGIETAGTKAIVSITTLKAQKAEEVLSRNGYDMSSCWGLFVKSSMEDGSDLQDVTKMLRRHRIHIKDAQVVAKDRGNCVVALNVDRPRAAYKVLEPMLVNKTY